MFNEKSSILGPLFIGIAPGFIFILFSFYNSLQSTDKKDLILYICLVGFITLTFIFIMLMRLTVIIDENGIQYKYFPFHFKFKEIKWENINDCQIVKYDAYSEFLGWGFRKKSKKYGIGYTTKGDFGIWIKMDNENIFLSVIDEKIARIELEKYIKQKS